METITMSRKERLRLEVLSGVRDGGLSLTKAGALLAISYRQMKRLWSRYQSAGDAGLVHGLRGRASNRQVDGSRKERALALYREKYADYGPTLAAECLQREDGLPVSTATLRGWLIQAGCWEGKRRRRAHRRRRARKEHRGELLQMDGSHHDWFEGRRVAAVLMVMIDDATGAIYARFFETESLASACETFRRYASLHGLPQAVYVDRHGIYRADREPTADELLAGQEPETQFGRAMRQLQVRLILARSPQAKGRVERVNGTLQDRLVKALRRANISDLTSANAFLEAEYLADFNAQFSVAPAQATDLHRALPADVDLDAIFCVQEGRVVQNDWTVRWHNRFLQLPSQTSAWVQPGAAVTVCESFDGRLRVFAGEQELAWSATRSQPQTRRPPAPRSGPTGSNQGQKPSANHPWRRSYAAAKMKPSRSPTTALMTNPESTSAAVEEGAVAASAVARVAPAR